MKGNIFRVCIYKLFIESIPKENTTPRDFQSEPRRNSSFWEPFTRLVSHLTTLTLVNITNEIRSPCSSVDDIEKMLAYLSIFVKYYFNLLFFEYEVSVEIIDKEKRVKEEFRSAMRPPPPPQHRFQR